MQSGEGFRASGKKKPALKAEKEANFFFGKDRQNGKGGRNIKQRRVEGLLERQGWTYLKRPGQL